MNKWERIPLTPDEVTRVIDATETLEERVALTFLADTGCRVNELIRMDMTWFDFGHGKYGVVNVPPKPPDDIPMVVLPGNELMTTCLKRGAKTKNVKHIPLTKRLSDILWNGIPGWFENNNRLLRSSVWVYNVCLRCAKRAGIEKRVTPHIFRHSYCTNAFYEGKLKPLEIAKLAGHVDSKMVETVYLKVNDDITAKKLEDSGWLD